LQLYAPHEAVVHLTRALAAARHLPAVGTPDLHHARGHAYEIIGERTAAQADYEAALQEAQLDGRASAIWPSIKTIPPPHACIIVRRYGEALAMLQASLQIALESEHHWWATQSWASLRLLYTELLTPRRALVQLQSAMAEARSSGLNMLIRDVGRYLVGAQIALRSFSQAEAAL
jgi:hypothetical protein